MPPTGCGSPPTEPAPTTAPLLAYDQFRSRGLESVILFASLMVLGEWTQHVVTPFASWGAAAHTQLDNLPLLQLASITGSAGVSWLVYLVGASAEATLAGTRSRQTLVGAAALVLAVTSFGSVRLASMEVGTDMVTVAAIDTDSDITDHNLPAAEAIAAWNDLLAQRTRRAAAGGAELAVWTEAATMVRLEDEPNFLAEVGALARDAQIEVVAGYIIPMSTEPFTYYNRYAWFSADGELLHTYDKHRPVAGEPAIAGDSPMPLVETDGQRRSGAICYDYDYPRLGLEHSQLDVDLVALPSSDWRGIDPIHTQMASLRAIEGGHSVLRSTRWGLSAGIDPSGRLRGWQSAQDANRDGMLLVSLPKHGQTTVYGVVGDWFIVMSGLLSLTAVARLRRREARHPCPPPASSPEVVPHVAATS